MTPHPDEIRATGTAGSVLLIDSRLWHCIPPNPTNRSRVAFAVRFAPWWLDTSVVMPGSAARARIVDGVGSVDTGGSHAGIPLGNPSQPALPPGIYEKLCAAGGGSRATAALYEHWLPPREPPPLPPPPTERPLPVEVSSSKAAPSLQSSVGVHDMSDLIKQNGHCVLTADSLCLPPLQWDAAQAASGVDAVKTITAHGLLDNPTLLVTVEGALGRFARVANVQPPSAVWDTRQAQLHDYYTRCDYYTEAMTTTIPAKLSCTEGGVWVQQWPHAAQLAGCVSAPPLARLHQAAALVLHVHYALERCSFNVQYLGETTAIFLERGDAAVLDSRISILWGDRSPPPTVRISYATWWFDASALALGSTLRMRLEQRFTAGQGPPLPVARPSIALDEVASVGGLAVWDLLQHWQVEQGTAAVVTVARGLEAEGPAALLACKLDLVGAYGRVWALQQLLQCGGFDLLAQQLHAVGPAGMGRSFMAAKVRSDSRAALLLPLMLGAAWRPSVPLLLLAHAANVYLHASRAPFIWDHELWDM